MVESEEVSLQATVEAKEGFCCSKCHRQGNYSTVWGATGFLYLGF